jgi:preprotein translocase subunit SecA
MAHSPLLSKLKHLHQRLNGSAAEYDLHPYHRQLLDIVTWSKQFAGQSETQLQASAQMLKIKAHSGEPLDLLLPETFGLVYEITRRVLSLTPFDEQLIAGIVMHHGKLAQMQTGEGKTLAAVFPACLHALIGKGTHVLTFNDYLARRDSTWMGPIYSFFGLSVGIVQGGMSRACRQQAYASDITYLTAKESGFDFLRDSLALDERELVQRAFHFAIIDEADSILIDEARIPLIIAAASRQPFEASQAMAVLVKTLREKDDVAFDNNVRNVHLTDMGLKRAETWLGCGNLYEENNLDLLTRLNCALHAEFLLQKDKDYIVRNGQVELVDEFTGRIAERRRWPDGLQAAIEAKENLIPQSQGRILNTITLQHFLRQYPQLSGMTATASPAEEEFREVYGLNIVVIPPHTPCIRQDHPDRLFETKTAKNQALVEEIQYVHTRKQPILVGTGSVAESTALAEILQSLGIACQVLNARQDDAEAEIIAQAGRLGAVTISTNMAGRGTDIRLGYGDDWEKEQVAKLGGLYVIGTNKHESSRIDDQLRGRSGRQGDPGASCFFISLEDDLFLKFKLKDLFPSHFSAASSTGSIADPLVLTRINQLQRIVEGQNLEIKKTLYKYSDLLEQQRKLLFQRRRLWLTTDTCLEFFQCRSPQSLQELLDAGGEDQVLNACRQIILLCLDQAWSQYLSEIADLREGIHLVRLGGGLLPQEPFVEFLKQATCMFGHLESELKKHALDAFHRIMIDDGKINLAQSGLKAPSSTWTYLVNDDPFELKLVTSLGGQIAMVMWWPLLMLILLIKKLKRKT